MTVRKIFLLLLFLFLPFLCRGQEVVHDEGFMSTFLFEWLGTGYPKDAAQGYFDIIHPYYVSEYQGRSQHTPRIWMMQNFALANEYSDTIKNQLKRRADSEAWNLADRQATVADPAYLIEERKVSKYLMKCRNQIGMLRVNGANSRVEEYYRQRLGCLEEDLALTRSCYQPMSRRKEQYLAIYKGAEDLCQCLTEVMVLLRSMPRDTRRNTLRPVSQRRIVVECLSRWRDVMMSGREGYSFDN